MIFESVRFDEQGLGAALAVLRLAKTHSDERLETACGIALRSAYSPRYRQLKPIFDDQSRQAGATGNGDGPDDAGFVRGGDYYGRMAAR